MSDNDDEKSRAVDKAISLCEEVVNTSRDSKQVDSALHMLQRIYTETYRFDKALEVIEKQSADQYLSRISGKASVLAAKGDSDRLACFAEESIWRCFRAIHRCLERYTGDLRASCRFGNALKFHLLDKRLLELFDDECADFGATDKIINAEYTAQCYMGLGDKDGCLEELKRFAALASDVKKVAKIGNEGLHPSKRCSYFSNTQDPDLAEEWMSDVYPERALAKYDAFFGDHDGYALFKASLK